MGCIVFVTGGVVSSLGKGISASSLGALLKLHDLKVSMLKMDPYINVDPGTMSPYQHGEVFVTDDGAETDLDLGHYERFLGQNLSKANNVTSGQIYNHVINAERSGVYLGATVQVIPHITDEMQRRITNLADDCDILIVEIGGTVGDIESLPFLEAIRQISFRNQYKCIFMHVTLVPFLAKSMEFKTKPTQHSVKDLRAIGIQPDMLICRSEQKISEPEKDKISLFTNVPKKHIFCAPDASSIYQVPLILNEQGMDQATLQAFGLPEKKPNLHAWVGFDEKIKSAKNTLNIAIVGKYVTMKDAYLSVHESLTHASAQHNIKINISYVDAEHPISLKQYHGIVIPGGFGERCVEGKMAAIAYVRKHNVPVLGICFGMQLMVIEFLQNVVGLADANSLEINANTKNPVFLTQRDSGKIGATMRLGAEDLTLVANSKIAQIYQKETIRERHRHRYDMNLNYVERIEKQGLNVGAWSESQKIVETVELVDHPFFMGCQFHPEFLSKPHYPHPLFEALVQNALEYKKNII